MREPKRKHRYTIYRFMYWQLSYRDLLPYHLWFRNILLFCFRSTRSIHDIFKLFKLFLVFLIAFLLVFLAFTSILSTRVRVTSRVSLSKILLIKDFLMRMFPQIDNF